MEDDYFNFLYFFALGSKYKHDKYLKDICWRLHHIDYYWTLKMDENRMYDGEEMRKYYLADDNGYLSDYDDIYDPDIFPQKITVFEVLVGFSNRLRRDVSRSFPNSKNKWGIIGVMLSNIFLVLESKKSGEIGENLESIIDNWMRTGELGVIFDKSGERHIGIFGEIGEKDEDLLTQAFNFINFG
jgi:hypothetical protein